MAWVVFNNASANLNIRRSEWKIVGSNYIGLHDRMPLEKDINEYRFNDGHFQPFPYKYIEWIFIPRIYKPYPHVGLVVNQDIDGFVAALENSGKQFPLIVDERGITILGYQ